MKSFFNDTIFVPFSGFHLYAGFSGGADSTAALLLAKAASEKYGFDLTAVHFNHHLRGEESDAEALAAENFAAEKDIPFLKFDIYPLPGKGVENRARQERLKIWKELAGNRQDRAVILGHHFDDRVENLLIRLGRGSNASGAAGLRSETVVDGVRILRPLFDWRRQDVENFLRSCGVEKWAEDSSNSSCDALRNLLRNRILPELYSAAPGFREGLGAAVKNLAADAEFLESEAAARLRDGDPGTVVFWQNLPEALLPRVLRMFLEKYDVFTPVPQAAVQRFREALRSGSGILPLGSGITLRIAGAMLFAGEVPPPPEVVWHWKSVPEIKWGNFRFQVEECREIPSGVSLSEVFFDAENLPDTLKIGAAVPGERMIPFGGCEPVKVKKLRIDRKVPSFPALPLLRDMKGNVLWMAFVRHSSCFPARAGRKIIRIFGEKTE